MALLIHAPDYHTLFLQYLRKTYLYIRKKQVKIIYNTLSPISIMFYSLHAISQLICVIMAKQDVDVVVSGDARMLHLLFDGSQYAVLTRTALNLKQSPVDRNKNKRHSKLLQ